MINVEVYKGTEANVNSFILSDTKNIIVVDLLRSSKEAEMLADHIENSGKNLHAIFITHGHPDHYIGLGVFHSRFPNVPVKVATKEIRDDIVGFSQWMESVGWLDAEPHMKVKTDDNPNGFDYANVISVLDEPYLTLPLEENKIQVRADYPGNECGHLATLAIHEQKTFIASDLLYNGVHAWCGPGVDKPEINSWIEVLNQISKIDKDGSWTFFAGHGGSGDRSIVTAMQNYLRTFLEVTASAKTQEGAIKKLKAQFPGFAQEDFLLVHSVNFHVKES